MQQRKLGYPVVIDAKKFATAYNAFWQNSAPTNDLFVRRVNLGGYERWAPPLDTQDAEVRKALSAEYAFSLFAIRQDVRSRNDFELSKREVHFRALEQAKARLCRYVPQGLELDLPLSKAEKVDAQNLARRLGRFFSPRRRSVVARPIFPGCGYIDESEGDVLFGSTLFEVKAVDRMIRGVDLRQLLTYVALNFSAKKFGIDRIGWFNPRRGITAEFELEEICFSISGKRAAVLLFEIVEAVSGGDISR